MPAKQRNEQQQTQKTATRDDACEISPRPHHIEVTTIPNIFVGGLLNVLTLSAANIGKTTTPCTATTTHTASCAVFPRANAASAAIPSSAASCACISTCTTIAACTTGSTESASTMSAIHHDCRLV